MSESAQARSARSLNLLLCLSLGLTIGLLIIVAELYTKPGWDAQFFYSAARVAGMNPYSVRDLGLELSWNYQPYLLTAFNALCAAHIQLEHSYPLLDVLLLIGGVAMWSPKSSFLLAVALSIGGFWGFGWTLLTGNITAVVFLLVSIVIVLLGKRRWEMAGLVLGILASIKLFAIVYIGLLLFIPESNSRRLQVIALSLFVFALTFRLSYALYPTLFQSFLEQIFGLVPNQHNVWMETGKLYGL